MGWGKFCSLNYLTLKHGREYNGSEATVTMATHHKLLNIHVEGRVRLGNLDLDLDLDF